MTLLTEGNSFVVGIEPYVNIAALLTVTEATRHSTHVAINMTLLTVTEGNSFVVSIEPYVNIAASNSRQKQNCDDKLRNRSLVEACVNLTAKTWNNCSE